MPVSMRVRQRNARATALTSAPSTLGSAAMRVVGQAGVVYDTILGGTPTGELTNVDAFTTATDDARTIINYLHEYSVPASE